MKKEPVFGSFTAEAPGLRTIVVMEKDESKIDVFS